MECVKTTWLTWKTTLLHQLLLGHHLHRLEQQAYYFHYSSAMKFKSPLSHWLVTLLYCEGAEEHGCHNRDFNSPGELRHLHLHSGEKDSWLSFRCTFLRLLESCRVNGRVAALLSFLEISLKKGVRRNDGRIQKGNHLPGSPGPLVLFGTETCSSVACLTNVTVTVHQPGFACCTLHTVSIVRCRCVRAHACVLCAESWEGTQWLSHIQPQFRTVRHHLSLFTPATIGPIIVSFSTIKELLRNLGLLAVRQWHIWLTSHCAYRCGQIVAASLCTHAEM